MSDLTLFDIEARVMVPTYRLEPTDVIEVGTTVSTIYPDNWPMRDVQHFGVVVGFEDDETALVDYCCGGVTRPLSWLVPCVRIEDSEVVPKPHTSEATASGTMEGKSE